MIDGVDTSLEIICSPSTRTARAPRAIAPAPTVTDDTGRLLRGLPPPMRCASIEHAFNMHLHGVTGVRLQ